MAVNKQLEVESKFSVDTECDVPDLSRIVGVKRVDPSVVYALSAIYFDTADLDLLRARITLRRRTGGKDAGWHLKVGAANARLEIQHPLDEETRPGIIPDPPQEIVDIVSTLIRGKKLSPIARVDNDRHTCSVFDADDEELAEFCDDHVTAWSFLSGGRKTSWREWEFELSPRCAAGQEAASTALSAAAVLEAAGAQPPLTGSKLVSALGESGTVILSKRSASSYPGGALGNVVRALDESYRQMVSYDPLVRVDATDSVHQMRVACRQLRSLIDTYDGIIDAARLADLTHELKHFAKLLGHARDAEVIAEHLRAIAHEPTAIFVDEEFIGSLAESFDEDYARAHAKARAFMSSSTYYDMLDRIDELVSCPPVPETSGSDVAPSQPATPPQDINAASQEAAAPAVRKIPDKQQGDTADQACAPSGANNSDAEACSPQQDRQQSTASANNTPFTRSTAREQHAKPDTPSRTKGAETKTQMSVIDKLAQAMAELDDAMALASASWLDDSISASVREDYFHTVRKIAKKVRYATAAAEGSGQLKLKKFVDALKQLQDHLGQFQDAVVFRQAVQARRQQAVNGQDDTQRDNEMQHDYQFGVLTGLTGASELTAIDEVEQSYARVPSLFAKAAKKAKISAPATRKK